ncbi:MAG: hypothetical protein WCY29_05935 [Novosphingobium sp.]
MSFKVSDAFLDEFHRLGAKDGHEYGEPPAKKLSLLLRPTFIAPRGKVLVWGDFSNIEARVLPWLAQSRLADAKLDIFRTVDADPNEPDVYVRTAADLVGRDAGELWEALGRGDKEAKALRQSHGKVPELALGFGGGLGALQAMATTYGVYLDEKQSMEMIRRWRDANAWARTFWGAHGREGSYGLWGAANSAIENPDTIFPAGRVAYVYDRSYLKGTLFCALPCGRLLTYPAIKWEWREVEDKQTGRLVDRYQLTYLKGYGRTAAWYGKLCVDGSALVATDNGWKKLRDITTRDKVFDGVEFVGHDGLCFKGKKLTISVDGVRMTPDHEVLTDAGWKQAQDCSGLHRAGFREPYGSASGTAAASREDGTVGLPLRVRELVRMFLGRVVEAEQKTFAAILRVRDEIAHWFGELDTRRLENKAVCSLALYAGPLSPAFSPSVGALRRAGYQGLRALVALRELLGGHGADVPGRLDAGTGGRERRLLARELHMGDVARTGVEQAELAADEHGRGREANGYRTLDIALSLEPRAVYDLVNAGPRRRFMVLGERGPFIVHNCENVTQAGAASVLRRTLKRLDRDAAWRGLSDTVMHTHDEVVQEVMEGMEVEAARWLKHQMVTNDGWDAGLPLAAEISSNWYYSKAVKEMEI